MLIIILHRMPSSSWLEGWDAKKGGKQTLKISKRNAIAMHLNAKYKQIRIFC